MAVKPQPKMPLMEHPFEILVTGQETGVTYTGTFKYKRPSLGERSRIEAMKVRMNGDLELLDEEVRDYNHAIAHLRFTLHDYPDWWQAASFGIDLYDGNVVAEVYNKCMEFEATWKDKVFGGDASKVIAGDPAHAVKEAVVAAN